MRKGRDPGATAQKHPRRGGSRKSLTQEPAPIPPPRALDRGLPPLLAALSPASSLCTALPARNAKEGPSTWTEKARQSLTHSPRAGWTGWTPVYRWAGQLMMAPLVCGNQRRPLFSGDRDWAGGCWLRRLEAEGRRQQVWVHSSPPSRTQAGNCQNEGPSTLEEIKFKSQSS